MHCDKKNVIQVTPIILIPYNNLGGDGMIHYTHWRHQQQGKLTQHRPHHKYWLSHTPNNSVVALFAASKGLWSSIPSWPQHTCCRHWGNRAWAQRPLQLRDIAAIMSGDCLCELLGECRRAGKGPATTKQLNNAMVIETMNNVSHGEVTWNTIWNTTAVRKNCTGAYICVFLSY